MCNSFAKFPALFAASRKQNREAEMASWLEKPNKRVKLPTSALGVMQLLAHIPAAEIETTVTMGHGALPSGMGEAKLARSSERRRNLRLTLRSYGGHASGLSGQARRFSGHACEGRTVRGRRRAAGPRCASTAMGKSNPQYPDPPSPDSFVKNSSWKTEVLLPGSWRGATSTLLSRGSHHIIIDTGMPHEAHRLLGTLEQRGLQPSDIRMVINTHFHVDHVLNNCLFPESDIYGSQQSYEWCCQAYADLLDEQNWEKLSLKYYPESADYEKTSELMGALRRFALRWWDCKRLGDPSRFRWIETHALPDDLEFLVTNGHVPGHASVIVHHGDQPIIIAGDALLTREHDENVFTMIPHNRRQFQEDRAHILARMGRIVPGHDEEFSNRNGEPPMTS
jgi:glyoxylase-like metal-dependent hydrolase (beta-lactamase superfamily II)